MFFLELNDGILDGPAGGKNNRSIQHESHSRKSQRRAITTNRPSQTGRSI